MRFEKFKGVCFVGFSLGPRAVDKFEKQLAGAMVVCKQAIGKAAERCLCHPSEV